MGAYSSVTRNDQMLPNKWETSQLVLYALDSFLVLNLELPIKRISLEKFGGL